MKGYPKQMVMLGLGRSKPCCQRSVSGYWQSRKYSRRSSDPLKILFCGSDNFSIASLNALHTAAQEDRKFIESIEVVSRPGKWTGPHKKIYKEVPIAERARFLKLPLHQIDTFRGWTPPVTSAFNLIIAVSFGLLIPRRLIEAAKYGGLNVHPSMLPDLWGPAPLQHALLDNDKYAGLTVQTLHPTTMDKGAILAQTDSPGLMISDGARGGFASFVHYMAPYGADLLLETLRQGFHVQPAQDSSSPARLALGGQTPRHARKLDIEDRHVDWSKWPAEKILRYQKLLQTLWNNFDINGCPAKLVWSKRFEIAKATKYDLAVAPGVPYTSNNDRSWLINTVDSKALKVYECTVAGDKTRRVAHVAKKYNMIQENSTDRRLKALFK